MLDPRSFWFAATPVLVLVLLSQYLGGFSTSLQHVVFQLDNHLPAWAPTLVAKNRPRITIPQATVVGTTIDDLFPHPVEAFLRIPYAVPPVGDLRFRPAVPVAASSRVLDASHYGPICPGKQLIKSGSVVASSEDCLTANVFRPQGVNEGERLPVAIYVHGGAFNRGSAKMHNTASMLGWSEKPFVAVSFGYRIGALGFLPSEVTAKEGVLNLGLRDQILLFQWVQDNIESFGGDPSQVTLFGLSAGAHSIAHHIMNHNEKEPLFHRAIIESGAATSRAVHPYNARLHEDQFREFVTEAGCSDVADDSIMACLRSKPTAAITAASTTVFDRYNPSVRWAFQPVIDGEVIKRRTIDAWRSGIWNKMPIITGFNSNEGTYYVPKTLATGDEFLAFFRTLLPVLTDADIRTIDQLYPNPETDAQSPYVDTRDLAVGPQYKRVEAAYGHYAYACPVRQTATLMSAGQTAPVFLYRWALNKTVLGGANHGDQMEYETFSRGVWQISDSQKEAAGTLHAYFTSFITTGQPNDVGGRYASRPEWEAYNRARGKIMVFGEGNDERAGGEGTGVSAQLVGDEWSRKECQFWWKKSEIAEFS